MVFHSWSNSILSLIPTVLPSTFAAAGLEWVTDEGRRIPTHPLLNRGSASFSDLSGMESGKFELQIWEI